MGLFKKNPYKCKYFEIWLEYPTPNGVPLKYNHRFTNKPKKPYNSCGDLGLGYKCFNLDDKKDINLICRLNYGYKKNNDGIPYINHELLMLCVNINTKRGMKK